jgi:predicted nuclease of predicted toxin-antitoxin system
MKFLVDTQLPIRLAQLLREAGYNDNPLGHASDC